MKEEVKLSDYSKTKQNTDRVALHFDHGHFAGGLV